MLGMRFGFSGITSFTSFSSVRPESKPNSCEESSLLLSYTPCSFSSLYLCVYMRVHVWRLEVEARCLPLALRLVLLSQ